MQNLNEPVQLTLTTAECLVIFELLTQSYEEWRKNNPNDASKAAMILEAKTLGQRRALWHLEGAIERTLVQIFHPDYKNLVQEADGLLGEN